MPKDKLIDYSATNGSNTDVGGVNIDEGCLPSGINNAIREVMTHLKDFSEGTEAVNAIAVDNLKLDGNTLSSTDTNGNVTIDPNGTGNVVIEATTDINGNELILDADGDTKIEASTDDVIKINTANTERVRIGARYVQFYQTDANERFRFDNDTGKFFMDSEGGALNCDVDIRQGSAKHWITYNETQTVTDSYNNSSITDLGTGNHRYNFTNNMNAAKSYTISGTMAFSGDVANNVYNIQPHQDDDVATSSIEVVTVYAVGASVFDYHYNAASSLGDLA